MKLVYEAPEIELLHSYIQPIMEASGDEYEEDWDDDDDDQSGGFGKGDGGKGSLSKENDLGFEGWNAWE